MAFVPDGSQLDTNPLLNSQDPSASSETVGEVDISKYEIIEPLGNGAFGTVSLVKDKSTEIFYAMKNIKCSVMNAQQQEYLKREIEIMKTTDHPALLKMTGYVLPTRLEPTAIIITEYMPNGSLFNVLELERKGEVPREWNATAKTKLIIGLAAGMRHLHRHDIIHRDLKSDNILLNDYLEPKICDFGLSRKADSSESKMTKRIGTPLYMAPELFEDAPYTNKVDVYAFAILTYETITGINPFSEVSNPIALGIKIMKGMRPEFPDETPYRYKDLIRRCWSGDPMERPDFESIVKELLEPEFMLPGSDESEVNDYRRLVCPEFNTVTYNMLLSVQNYFVARVDTLEQDVESQYKELVKLRREKDEQDAQFKEMEKRILDMALLFADLKKDNDALKNELNELRTENAKLREAIAGTGHATKDIPEDSKSEPASTEEEEEEEEENDYFMYQEHSDAALEPCIEASFESETDAFSGVIRKISEYNGGKNPCEIGIVHITGDSYNYSDKENLSRLVDFTWDGSWGSAFSDSAWIMFEFVHNTIDVKAYSLKTNQSSEQPLHLKSWVLQASNDMNRWTELDRVDDENSPTTGTYVCQTPCSDSFRYIRLLQTGPGHGGSGSGFALTNIEFFGSLY